MRERTVYLLVTKLVLENLYEGMPKVPPRCVDWLHGQVKRRIHHQRTTHYTSWLVDDNKFTFGIVMNDFHRFRGDRRFMPVYHIPRTGVESAGCYENAKISNSIRSPFWIMVSGLAIFPLIVVTPDSRAYLWMEAWALPVWTLWKKTETHVVVDRPVSKLCGHNLQHLSA